MGRKRTKPFYRNRGFAHIGKELPRYGASKNIFDTVEMRRVWNEVVGELLSKKTCVKKLQGTKLIVSVEHGGWAYQLGMMKDDLLEKISKKTKSKILDIDFKQETIEKADAQRAPTPSRDKFSATRPDIKDRSLKDIIEHVQTLHRKLT